MRRVCLVCLFISVCVLGAGMVNAQSSERLVNGGLEEGSSGPYTTRRGGEFPIYLPNSWNVWLASPTGEFFNRSERVSINPHPGPGPSPKEGNRALNVDCGFVTCTASIYQQVTVENNTNIQATAWAQVKACNLPDNGTTCGSAVESGAQTRIGIDPNGGTDPADGDIVWSGWVQPHDNWLQMTVSATTTGTTATLFLYSTQSSPADLNRTYWDQASLTGGGAGGAAASAATAAPTAPPEVAFVVPQNAREDGSIVHVVAEGDTIDSIAVAYGLTRPDILTLNPSITDPRIISIGQEIVIREPLPTEGESFTEEIEATDTPNGEAAAESTAEVEATEEGEATEEAAAANDSSAPLDFAASAPPAPVVSVAEGQPETALAASVCVMMFSDANQNRLQEMDETLLPGGVINLTLSGAVVQSVETDGVAASHCFDDVAAGDYVLAAGAPSGYGLTSPDQLAVKVAPGAAVNVAFGAAEGIQTAVLPPADAGDVTANEVSASSVESTSPLDQLMNISGLLIFGLAGVVLVAGVGLTLFLRRR